MKLEESRAGAAPPAQIFAFGGSAALASRASTLFDKHALQQIVNGCFVKLQKLRLLRCDSCEKTFHKRSRLMIHYFDTHVNEDLEESDISTGARVDVEKSTPDVENLSLTNCSGLKLHPCNICAESFAFKVDMLIHKLKHSGKEPQECEICQKHFLNKNQLNRHINYSHAADNFYTCDICYKQFQCLKYLKNHKKRHTDIKPYSCEFCKKKFANREYMMRHRRTHTGERPHICLCGRQFPFYSGLKYHRCTYANRTQLSKKVNELQCDYCHRKYNRRSYLIFHIKLHMNTEIYSCDYCNLKFSTPVSLQRHRAKHTGDLPHACNVCDSKFAMKYQLKRHMLTHTKEKKYSCEICDKRFLTKYAATSHLKIHTKAYQCTLCKQSFYHEIRLDRHLKRCQLVKSSFRLLRSKQSKAKKSSTDSDSSVSNE